jgi:hypothetical protein
MAKQGKQAEAVNQIKEFLSKRGLEIDNRNLSLESNQRWVVLEHGSRQVGVDSVSGIWLRESLHYEWHCIAMPCTISGAIQAAEFLSKD